MKSAETKLAALLKRQSDIKAALSAEREKRKMQAAKDQGRLTVIVGRSALANAAQSPDFKQLLVAALRTTVTDPSEEKFLKAQGWL
ncbi:MAG TPA: hypothetical protein VMB85_03085 [Bryobacteraceae bacterium]|nr:hypothetical protein [Bryobacteraceae bacterium]